MKYCSFIVALACAICLSHTTALAAPTTKFCSRVESVRGSKYIYKQSAPLRAGGVGTRLIGYRKEPTLIMNKGGGSRSGATIYSYSGKQIGRCPWASAEGHAGRYRCTMQTKSLRASAVKASRNPGVLFKINGTTCVDVPDAGRCYGSSKGLCSQTIK